jgi:hypothetical protein
MKDIIGTVNRTKDDSNVLNKKIEFCFLDSKTKHFNLSTILATRSNPIPSHPLSLCNNSNRHKTKASIGPETIADSVRRADGLY